MSSRDRAIRWIVVAVTVAAIAAALCFALGRIRIDSDLTATIPAGSAKLEASRKLLAKHPIIDRVAIDLSLRDESPAVGRLVQAAEKVEARLRSSGLFASVGNQQSAKGVAELYPIVTEQLPVLFDENELEGQVAPRLSESRVRAAVRENFEDLHELSGVGHAEAITKDPLRLRALVLQRLARLSPAPDARLEGDHIVSADGRHLLFTALPHRSAGDPKTSRQLQQLFDELAREIEQTSANQGQSPVVLTVAGAFRAAVDNEQIAKRDTHRAVLLVGVGIVVLLLICFARPLLGLMALLPATGGVAGALLLFSLFSERMSALALGFGAALVSITVDQGIVYVSHRDRLRDLTGREIAREVLPATSLATLTTAGAFLALRLSGYQLLAELGTFAALGVIISFAFVQVIFPVMLRTVPETRRRPLLPVDSWLRKLAARTGRKLLLATAAFFVVMLVFARPTFQGDLHAMNTLSPETKAAEQQIRRVWGDVFSNVYVFLEGDTVADLQDKADQLAEFLDEQRAADKIKAGWSPSVFFPGQQLAARNAAAWQRFWNPQRRAQVVGAMTAAGEEVGFSEEAFSTFIHATEKPTAKALAIPPAAYELLGISRARDQSGWVWLGTVQRAKAYDAKAFSRQAAQRGIGVFDGPHFGSVLGEFLSSAFLRMLLIIGAFVVLSVTVAFLSPRLILLTLAPVVFGLVCTLGTLGLLQRAIDIPGLILALVVFGLGIDFSFHFVRGYQRHPDENDPSHDSVRVAVLLASGSTLLGMVSIALADHAALRSAGLGGLLGITYCAVGAFIILPPLQRRLFRATEEWPEPEGLAKRKLARVVARRYRYLHPHPQIYARLKLRLDPMFARLHELVGPARTVLDVGCGYGVPAAWLAAHYPQLRVLGVEPDRTRALVANWVLRGRGCVVEAKTPEIPEEHVAVEAALLLDVAHYLPDRTLQETLRVVHERLAEGGRLVMRETVPSDKRIPWERWVEWSLLVLRGIRARFRSSDKLVAMLEEAGFSVTTEPTPGREETWFVAHKHRPEGANRALGPAEA